MNSVCILGIQLVKVVLFQFFNKNFSIVARSREKLKKRVDKKGRLVVAS